MSITITTQQYMDLIGSDTEALNKTVATYLLDSTALFYSIFRHALVIYSESKQLLKVFQTQLPNVVIDPNGEQVEFLEKCQQKIKLNYQIMRDIKSLNPMRSLFASINCYLLKKTFDNYGLIIINIKEHDVDVAPNYSAAFDSVEDLMKALHS